ncbi:MAG: HlyD family secretion protein [Gammaproteobacteria bacterium]|nr:HlyD family secretion protein [Gammaproteobacteria bacterium]
MALMILGPALIIGLALWFYFAHQGSVSTENAYVQANIVRVSPRVAGRIIALPVHDHEHVEKGEVLLKLDPASYQTAVAAAEANLAAMRDQVAALKAQYRALSAEIESAESQADFLAREVQRNRPLAKQKVITHAKLDKLNTQLERSRKEIAVLKAQRHQVLARLGGDPEQPIEQNAAWLQAKAALEQAQLNLADTVLRAPADGVLGHVGVRVGDTLGVGQAAFPLVETGHVWVKANFKETALTHMRPGQPATVTVDSYPNHSWKAHVQSISPASGAVFSLLPPQNASGNWVKVVQRIPVHIDLDDTPPGYPVLRAGMSAEVTVNVSVQPDHGQ